VGHAGLEDTLEGMTMSTTVQVWFRTWRWWREALISMTRKIYSTAGDEVYNLKDSSSQLHNSAFLPVNP
jgi:hypothetical protein